MATSAIYQINASNPNYCGSITVFANKQLMQYNRSDNATNVDLTKMNNRWKTKFAAMVTYYTA